MIPMLIQAVIVLVVLGVVVYLVEQYIPMSPPIVVVLRVLVVLIVALWLLRLLGLWSGVLPLR